MTETKTKRQTTFRYRVIRECFWLGRHLKQDDDVVITEEEIARAKRKPPFHLDPLDGGPVSEVPEGWWGATGPMRRPIKEAPDPEPTTLSEMTAKTGKPIGMPRAAAPGVPDSKHGESPKLRK